MKLIDNIRSFLYDKDYFVNIFENYIHVFNYLNLFHFSNTEITLKLEKFTLKIKGANLSISKMMEKEILIEGIIENVEFIR